MLEIKDSGVIKSKIIPIGIEEEIIRNDIGKPGEEGFGIGIYPFKLLPSGFSEMEGTTQIGHENYGNYLYEDGSVMCWIPKFYYRTVSNIILIASALDFASRDVAEGYDFALHRAFIDDGIVKAGFFYDKYFNSALDNKPVSVKDGIPFTFNEEFNPFPLDFPNNSHVVDFSKLRGESFFTTSVFIRNAVSLLSLAHAHASSDVKHCAWYDFYEKMNYPKGCNNGRLGDVSDGEIRYEGVNEIPEEGDWIELPRGLNSGHLFSDNKSLTGSGNVFVAGFAHGWSSISEDKGKTWKRLPPGLNCGSESAEAGCLASSGNVFVSGHTAGYASISRDKGETWEALEKGLNCGQEGLTVQTLAASGSTFIAGFGSGYASISDDKGETWEPLDRDLNSGTSSGTINVISADGDIIVAGFGGGFASISRDRGKNWYGLPKGLNCGSVSANIYSMTVSGDIIVAGFMDGYASISTDSGETWEALERGLNCGDMESGVRTLVSSGDVFVAGMNDGYASISIDKGKTWEALERGLSSGNANSSSGSMAISDNVLVAGFSGGYASMTNDITKLSSVDDDFLSYPKTGSGKPFAKTTHNGQDCGVADLNGTRREVTIGATFWGVTSDSEAPHDTPVINTFCLKEEMSIVHLTGGWETEAGGYGAWGNRAHVESLYEPVVTLITGRNSMGKIDEVTFNGAVKGDQWLRTCMGIPKDDGFSELGTDTYGKDSVDITSRENRLFSFGGDQSSNNRSGIFSVEDADIYSSTKVTYGYRCASFGY